MKKLKENSFQALLEEGTFILLIQEGDRYEDLTQLDPIIGTGKELITFIQKRYKWMIDTELDFSDWLEELEGTNGDGMDYLRIYKM